MKKLWRAMLPVLVCAGAAQAHGWSVNSLPDPRTDPLACGRQVEGWTCSPDGLVKEYDLSVIQGYISSIYAAEYPYSALFCPERGEDVPVEIMAVIVKEVEGSGDVATKVADFTKGIHERFGVGAADCGSGAVVVVSVNDRQVYISTGALVGAQLKRPQISSIITKMRSDLRKQKYGRAIEAAVVDIGLILTTADIPDYDYDSGNDDYDGDYSGDQDGDAAAWPIIGGMVFVAVCWSALVASQRQCCKPYPMGPTTIRHPAAGPPQDALDASIKLEQIKRDLRAAKEGRYVSTSCPICLEDFGSYPGTNAPGTAGGMLTNRNSAAHAPPVTSGRETHAETDIKTSTSPRTESPHYHSPAPAASDIEEPLLSQHTLSQHNLTEACIARTEAVPHTSMDRSPRGPNIPAESAVADTEPQHAQHAHSVGYLPAITIDIAGASQASARLVDDCNATHALHALADRHGSTASAAGHGSEESKARTDVHGSSALPLRPSAASLKGDRGSDGARVFGRSSGLPRDAPTGTGLLEGTDAGASGSVPEAPRGGTQEADAGAAESEAGSAGVREAVALQCGHTFCEACITAWLSSHEECPICRQPAGRASTAELKTTAPAALQRGQHAAQHTAQQPGTRCTCSCTCMARGSPSPGRRSGFDLYGPEFEYRLRRLHHYHPRHVSNVMVNWMVDHEYGRSTVPSTHRGHGYSPAGSGSSRRHGSHSHAPHHDGGSWAATFSSQMSASVSSQMFGAGSQTFTASFGGGTASGGGGGGW